MGMGERDGASMTDHDLLIRIDERLKALWIWTENHDTAHKELKTYALEIAGVVAGIVFTAIVVLEHFHL